MENSRILQLGILALALNLPIAASGQGSQVEGILKHTNGYLTVYPYNASYDDGSFVKAYYDGNNKRLLFMNSASGVITGLYAGRIIATDNVGIGTSNPQEKLSVNGNIRAKEVKVETANWPDYVFKEGYDLMPLAELGAHIKAHGRLPGIPSAGEVEANGIELAEMNRKLLEKVEELTLHLIEKDRELASYGVLIAEQEAGIAELRTNQGRFEAALRKLENTINR